MITAMRRRLRQDSGITLIETMIYAVIGVVVVTIAGGLVASNARVNSTVQSSTRNSGVGQIISQSLTNGVLNADWASTPTTGTKQFFTVHTAGRAATVSWTCQAWYFDSTTNGGSMYTKSSTSAITAPTGTPTGWTLLGTGISAVGSTPVFSGSGTGISLSMNVKNTGSTSILISNTITKRQTAAGVTSCQ